MITFFLIARVLYAAVFIIAPLQVLASYGSIAAAPPLRRVPAPRIMVPAMSIVSILGAALVILGLWPDLGVILIMVFLIPVTFTMHAFWTVADPVQARAKRDAFLLNLCALGGGLLLFWVVNQTQHVPAALHSTPFFSRW